MITSIKNNQALLLDFDGTLTDYLENESTALELLFNQYKLPKEQYSKAINIYRKINDDYWDQFQKKTASLEELQYYSIRDFKAKYPVFNDNPHHLNPQYLYFFILTTAINPKEVNTLKKLKQMAILLLIITNGIHDTQTARINNLGLNKIIDIFFTSENVGFPKPHPEMFLKSVLFVKQVYPNIEAKDIWVVGDSYKADIEGAQPLGFQTCWISNGKPINSEKPTLVVNEINQFLDLYLEIKSMK